jgi:hypothetical protein
LSGERLACAAVGCAGARAGGAAGAWTGAGAGAACGAGTTGGADGDGAPIGDGEGASTTGSEYGVAGWSDAANGDGEGAGAGFGDEARTGSRDSRASRGSAASRIGVVAGRPFAPPALGARLGSPSGAPQNLQNAAPGSTAPRHREQLRLAFAGAACAGEGVRSTTRIGAIAGGTSASESVAAIGAGAASSVLPHDVQ